MPIVVSPTSTTRRPFSGMSALPAARCRSGVDLADGDMASLMILNSRECRGRLVAAGEAPSPRRRRDLQGDLAPHSLCSLCRSLDGEDIGAGRDAIERDRHDEAPPAMVARDASQA